MTRIDWNCSVINMCASHAVVSVRAVRVSSYASSPAPGWSHPEHGGLQPAKSTVSSAHLALLQPSGVPSLNPATLVAAVETSPRPSLHSLRHAPPRSAADPLLTRSTPRWPCSRPYTSLGDTCSGPPHTMTTCTCGDGSGAPWGSPRSRGTPCTRRMACRGWAWGRAPAWPRGRPWSPPARGCCPFPSP